MRMDSAYRKITADEFLSMDFGTDRKFELEDGVVQGNIHSWLRARLRGSSCRPYNSKMAVQISETEVRYPDVSIYCDQPPRGDLIDAKTLANPTVVIELLSPSTTTLDQGTKLEEDKRIESIRTIAFVDPINQMARTVERLEQGWLDHIFSGQRGIPIPALDLTIPHDEIFARD